MNGLHSEVFMTKPAPGVFISFRVDSRTLEVERVIETKITAYE